MQPTQHFLPETSLKQYHLHHRLPHVVEGEVDEVSSPTEATKETELVPISNAHIAKDPGTPLRLVVRGFGTKRTQRTRIVPPNQQLINISLKGATKSTTVSFPPLHASQLDVIQTGLPTRVLHSTCQTKHHFSLTSFLFNRTRGMSQE